jgi:hypothetical protein
LILDHGIELGAGKLGIRQKTIIPYEAGFLKLGLFLKPSKD